MATTNSAQDAARNIRTICNSYKVKLHALSRIGQIITLLESGGVISPTDSGFLTALEGIRDIYILDFILNQMPKITDPDQMKDILRCINTTTRL
ncbi:MAG: hypothetical protein HZA50_08590 [Planctomycetes bacterium]|nr:hypothetical protein [Planctomycetota bacterium]